MTPIHTESTGFIFAPEPVKKIARQLRDQIENTVENEDVKICSTLNSLIYALVPKRSKPTSKQIIIVLFIPDQETLQDVFEFRVLLSKFSIIVVPAGGDPQLLAIAREMQPCSLIDMASAESSIAVVTEAYGKLRQELRAGK